MGMRPQRRFGRTQPRWSRTCKRSGKPVRSCPRGKGERSLEAHPPPQQLQQLHAEPPGWDAGVLRVCPAAGCCVVEGDVVIRLTDHQPEAVGADTPRRESRLDVEYGETAIFQVIVLLIPADSWGITGRFCRAAHGDAGRVGRRHDPSVGRGAPARHAAERQRRWDLSATGDPLLLLRGQGGPGGGGSGGRYHGALAASAGRRAANRPGHPPGEERLECAAGACPRAKWPAAEVCAVLVDERGSAGVAGVGRSQNRGDDWITAWAELNLWVMFAWRSLSALGGCVRRSSPGASRPRRRFGHHLAPAVASSSIQSARIAGAWTLLRGLLKSTAPYGKMRVFRWFVRTPQLKSKRDKPSAQVMAELAARPAWDSAVEQVMEDPQ